MKYFVRQCLHCTDAKVRNVLPRPLGDVLHGSEARDVLNFGCLSLGRSDEIDVGRAVFINSYGFIMRSRNYFVLNRRVFRDSTSN